MAAVLSVFEELWREILGERARARLAQVAANGPLARRSAGKGSGQSRQSAGGPF
jgi:DNA invertase Pin-like site-specific DNA recombinase